MANKPEAVEPTETNEQILSSVPIDPYSDKEYVIEGSEEAESLLEPENTPEVPESKENIKAQLDALQARLQAAEANGAMIKDLGSSLQQMALRPAPVAQQQETQEEMMTRLNNQWLENPAKTFIEQTREQVKPIVDLMLQQSAILSRELVMTDPEQKALYTKYRDEVEREVAAIPIQERAVEPRVYQVAIQRVKLRHSDELLEDRVAKAVADKLKELGIDENSLTSNRKPAAFSPTRPGGPAPSAKKTVVIPKAIVEEANRIGLEPKFLYEHRKAQGLIK